MGKSSTNIEEYLKKIKPGFYPLIAFILTAITETMIFSISGLLGNGKYVIARSDMTQQYLPFIQYFAEVLKGNHGLWYTWGMDMGMGTAGTFAYYTMSPFNLLFMIFPASKTMTAAALVIILKSSLAAAFFCLFARKFFRCSLFENVLFACMYGLCGFSICYYFNIIWTDSIYLFPLIMLGAYRLIRKNKTDLLLIAYLMQFVISFYMGFAVGIGSFLLILFYYLYSFKKRSVSANIVIAVKYAVGVISALMIAAIVWLPAVYQIFTNLDPTYPDTNEWQSNIVLLINNLLIGQMQNLDGLVPFVYSGLLTVIMVVLYFTNKRISKRERIYVGVGLLVMVATLVVQPLAYFMHGMDAPEMFAYRYVFIFSFIMSLIGVRQIAFIRGASHKIIGVCVAVFAAVFVGSYFIYDKKWITYNNCNTVVDALINILFFGLYAGLIILYRKKKTDILTLRMMAVLVCLAELTVNAYMIFPNINHTTETADFAAYADNLRHNTIEQINANEDKDYYRTVYLTRRMRNIGMIENVNSLSYFNSAENMNTNRVLNKLGVRRAVHLVDGSGLMPVTQSLFGVKYIVNGDSELKDGETMYTYALLENDDIYGRENGIHCYITNDRALSLGYMVNDEIKDFEFEKSPFANIDRILIAMTGEKVHCFESTGAELSCENGLYTFCNEDNNSEYLEQFNAENLTFLQHEDAEKEAGFIFKCEDDARPLYVYLSQQRFTDQSLGDDMVFLNTVDETPIYEYKAIPMYFIPTRMIRVGHSAAGDGYEFSVELPTDVPADYFEECYFSYYDDAEFQKAYDILSKHQWDITEFRDGYVRGTIDADKAGVMFTSIPYDTGWNVKVDGEDVSKVALLDSAFVGVDVPEGEHEIEMTYEAPGMNLAVVISIIGIFIAAILVLAEFVKSRRMVQV